MNYDNKHKVICALQGRPWKRPDNKGRWNTKVTRKRGPSQSYRGPSKKTLGKRTAKANRKNRR